MEFKISLFIDNIFLYTGKYWLRYNISKIDEHHYSLTFNPISETGKLLNCENIITDFWYDPYSEQFIIGEYVESAHIRLMPKVVYVNSTKAKEECFIRRGITEDDDNFINNISNWIKSEEEGYACEQLKNIQKTKLLGCKNGYKTYIIYNPNENIYKIGKSKNPFQRIKSFCDPDLILVAIHQRDIETEMHMRFFNKHKRGEWFKLSDRDIDELIEIGFKKVN